MSLEVYSRKRDFSRTREPAPRAPGQRSGRCVFVVQLHHASRRHYDLRLEVDGLLRSWAVPKGPSFDPAVKRMAVEVEDHPIDYVDFEGEIPTGQYGAGQVAIFDRGTWSTEGDAVEQLAEGHLRFELAGDRLRGGWHLVRTGRPGRKSRWLLFKDEDRYAGPVEADDLLDDAPTRLPSMVARGRRRTHWRKAALKLGGAVPVEAPPRAVEPQLAALRRRAPMRGDWIHEIKWDGYRMLVAVDQGEVRIFSRTGQEWTSRMGDVVEAVQALGLEDALIDGEVIVGGGRVEDFNRLQKVLSGEDRAPMAYVAFDLLRIDHVDITAAPLRQRKALLQRVLDRAPSRVSFSAHIEGRACEAFELAVKESFEGIVSKRADRPYRPGRGEDWIKLKAVASEEYAVVGQLPARGRRDRIGSLLLAAPDPVHGWRYAGRVGSGLSEQQLSAVAARLQGRHASQPTVHVPGHQPELARARWVSPEFVVEVFSRGTGSSGLLRQPSLKALRLDKAAADLGGDTRLIADDDAAPEPGKETAMTRKPRRKADGVVITHPERLVYPAQGWTKADVADYYRAAARWILPELRDRPLSVVRCPGGIDEPCFFQKHPPAGVERVDEVRVAEASGDAEPHLVVRDVEGLIELVQFGALEFHPWGALAADPDCADQLVFDLDPGPGIAWRTVVEAARQVRDLLAEAGLQSFVRTTGGKGLHVVAPLDPASPWEAASGFARAFAQALALMQPKRYVATAAREKRQGRIFIDHLRNRRGATAIASFSLRARPGAPVAMPLRWNELGRIDSGAHFDMVRARTRLNRLKGHPWEGFRQLHQGLGAVEDLLDGHITPDDPGH